MTDVVRPERDVPAHAAAPQIIWSFAADGECLLSEGPGLAGLGLQPGELVGRNLFQVYADSPGALEHINRAIGGEAFTTRVSLGSLLLETTYQPVLGSDGRVARVIGVSTDIGERLRLDERLQAARERAAALADLSRTLGEATDDPTAALAAAARSATTMLGDLGLVWLFETYAAAATVSLWHHDPGLRSELDEFVQGKDMAIRSMLQAVGAMDGTLIVPDLAEVLAVTPDPDIEAVVGRLGLRTSLNLPLRSRGRTIGVLVVLRGGGAPPFDQTAVALGEDIAERCAVAVDNARLLDERTRTTAQLRRFQALVETSVDFIAMADLQGKVTYVNPGGREMVGLEPDADVAGMPIDDFLTTGASRLAHDVERPAVLKLGHFEGESTLRDWRGGDPIPVAKSTFIVRDPLTRRAMAFGTVQRDLSERLAAEQEVRALAEQRRHLLERLVEAQEQERARIAADVHDDSVQALAAVDLRLGLLQRQTATDAPGLLDQVVALQGTVAAATDRLRSLLFDLEGPARGAGLGDVLRDAAAHVFEGTRTRWSVTVTLDDVVPEGIRVTAYRIVKEALVNVGKHAGAQEVRVEVSDQDAGMLVRVADDGVGPGAAAAGPAGARGTPGHLGVTSMRDRASAAGGWWRLDERAGGGAEVCFWLPYASS